MSGPIESYLGQLRAKLETRFEQECADQLVSEIHAHLIDAAEELEDQGVSRIEAESLAVSRFGAPEKAAFLLPLGKQFGTGDRYWGRGAFWAATVAALGLTWYALDPFSQRALSKEELSPILTLVLMFYAYACWRAKSYSMVRQSSVVIAIIVMVTGLFRIHVVDPTLRDTYQDTPPSRLLTQRTPTGRLDWSRSIADLGIHRQMLAPRLELAVDSAPSTGSVRPAPETLSEWETPKMALPGMAPIGQNPWDLARTGLLPDVSQLLLSWLFMLLMTNAAICWVGGLEHEQKGGVALVQ